MLSPQFSGDIVEYLHVFYNSRRAVVKISVLPIGTRHQKPANKVLCTYKCFKIYFLLMNFKVITPSQRLAPCVRSPVIPITPTGRHYFNNSLPRRIFEFKSDPTEDHHASGSTCSLFARLFPANERLPLMLLVFDRRAYFRRFLASGAGARTYPIPVN